MNLFIDTISKTGKIIIFDNNREIIDKKGLNIKGNESSSLIPELDLFLKANSLKYDDIENIVLVNGPGSFTGVRTTVLAINSINYIIGKNLTPMSYFDLFNSYPIIKSSSKRDCFVLFKEEGKIEIIPNEGLLEMLKEKNISKIYGDVDTGLFPEIELFGEINYLDIIKQIKFDNKKLIEPLYIKKPNIS